MKFGVVCDVDGKTYLENGITIEGEGINYIFYINNEGLLQQIRIISDVDDPEKYFFYKSPTAPDRTFTVNHGFEEHIREKLIRELQSLEGVLSLIGNIKRVYWNKPTFEYYPETTEEHARFNITPAWFFMHEMNSDEPTQIPLPTLNKLLQHNELFEALAVPMAFYREAKAEYSAARYISAFFNSYFIIEGLFGNGKWRSDAVIEALNKSTVFNGFVQNFINGVIPNNDPNEGMTKAQLEDELKTKNQPLSAEGLIKLIVKKRGELHHFSIGSTKTQGTPLNNADYKNIALITFALAGNCLIHYLGEKEKVTKNP